MYEASRGAGAQSVTVNAIDCGFDSEFRYSIHNASRIRRKLGNLVSNLTLGSLCLLYYVWYSMKLIKTFKIKNVYVSVYKYTHTSKNSPHLDLSLWCSSHVKYTELSIRP